MVEKEFNLSEKIGRCEYCGVIDVEDIKEFIKIILDECCVNTREGTKACGICFWCKAIKKRAGEKLVK